MSRKVCFDCCLNNLALNTYVENTRCHQETAESLYLNMIFPNSVNKVILANAFGNHIMGSIHFARRHWYSHSSFLVTLFHQACLFRIWISDEVTDAGGVSDGRGIPPDPLFPAQVVFMVMTVNYLNPCD